MTEDFGQNGSPQGSPLKLHGLSPQRYGSTAYKHLTYTPEKLHDNFIYREVTVTKKIEFEKNRIRELESFNSLLEQKVRHLIQQNSTVRQSFELQVEMYKKMVREQQEQARKIIKNLQSEYSLEIQKILQTHEEDSKVSQAETEQLERRIEQLMAMIDELEGHKHHGNNEITDLNTKLGLTQQKLANTEDKFSRAEEVSKQNIERLTREIAAMNGRLLQDSTSFKQHMDSFQTDKIREIQGLKRLHLTELDKLHNKRDAQMHGKTLELNDIKSVFQGEARRLEQIINNKDRVNQSLSLELKRQKERVLALTRNYDMEINQLVNQKDHILKDLESVNGQKNIMGRDLNDLAVMFDGERGRNAAVVNGLQSDIGRRNLELATQNQRLASTIAGYQRELSLVNQSANKIHKTMDLQRSEQVRRLLLQIKSLKDVLLESSLQMQKCKDQFLRQELEREQLMLINHSCEQEAIKLKAIISEQDMELRLRRY